MYLLKPVFEWKGKRKQVCRVNGVIIGFVVEGYPHRASLKSYRWDTRFSHCFKPHFDTAEEARNKIESIFIEWLNGIVAE